MASGVNCDETPHQNAGEDEDESERRHFQRIVTAFQFYRQHSLKRLRENEKHFNDIPPHHAALLPNFLDNLNEMRVLINHNYEVIKCILENTEHLFENRSCKPFERKRLFHKPSEYDMDKVKTTLRQFVRDWSEAGAEERARCYTPVINEIKKHFPPDQCKIGDVHILVPGAGLGRLAYEIAHAGYSCQGNEFSLFMLFASNFVLNRCHEVNSMILYPWIHQHSNNKSNEDRTRSITFPDVDPSSISDEVEFSMAAGDFLEIYKEPECWDCIATVYFIDTAHNIVSYIETIHRILKPGGIWINLGPLLYHFADMPGENSIELSYEDVRSVIKKFNFEILEEDLSVPSSYTQNQRSMLKYVYDCVFFVARKPLVESPTEESPTLNHTS